ncbi:hypothetical protein [Arcanobacterium bovis]|uniref:hypothetical protein n=1 Tax=Arcanobacterium bovis TaxID=2529275 RepID=UPI0019D57E3E|nr:hypothetical protein [Arcanobacterium bovis]
MDDAGAAKSAWDSASCVGRLPWYIRDVGKHGCCVHATSVSVRRRPPEGVPDNET